MTDAQGNPTGTWYNGATGKETVYPDAETETPTGDVYAMFQKAITDVYATQGDLTDGVVSVARIIWNLPKAKYTDEAVRFAIMSWVVSDYTLFHTTIPQQATESALPGLIAAVKGLI